MILCLETATAVCSVALCDGSSVIASRESEAEKSHASKLTVFIEDLLKAAAINVHDLEAVAVSKGPGSFTGLRIGVSVAKGIAYAAEIPLIGVETTLSMFHGFMSQSGNKFNIRETDIICPALDARRMEVYYSLYDTKGNTVKSIRAEIMDKNTFCALPLSLRIIIFGDGANKCRYVIKRDNVVFVDDFSISASFMQKPAYEAFAGKRFEDVAYFEPYYLKDFITSKPVKNILGK
jgi:tRNA threonylcarbamoyladenosine biosynthesis protein TsaB